MRYDPNLREVELDAIEFWKYYHSQPDSNPNASLYDIKLYFQGTKITKSCKVQMNSESSDEQYTELMKDLTDKLKILAKKIEPKIYEYGFLIDDTSSLE